MNEAMLTFKEGTRETTDIREMITNVNIPEGVTSIGGDTFTGCSALVEITIPDSVTSIGGGAFTGCTSLKKLTIPDSVTMIGDWAFSGCSSLKNIYIDKEKDSLDLSKTKLPKNCTVYWKGEF